jgi:polyhydroxyalkanoate synthesis regulator phasin
MTANESPFDSLVLRVRNAGYVEAADMLQQQAKEIKQLNFVLKNLTLATNKKMNELEEEIEHLKNKVQYWKGLHK